MISHTTAKAGDNATARLVCGKSRFEDQNSRYNVTMTDPANSGIKDGQPHLTETNTVMARMTTSRMAI